MPGIYIYMHVQNHAYTSKSRCTYICDICQLLNPASPLETQQNCVTTPSEILRPKTKTHGNSTWFFLDHPGNSILQTMLFLIKPGKFHQLFLQYPWKFHILLENICHKTTYTQEIELINSDVSERETITNIKNSNRRNICHCHKQIYLSRYAISQRKYADPFKLHKKTM